VLGFARSLCVSLAAIALYCGSALSQHLTITGRVTSTEGTALIQAVVSLDDIRLVAMTGADGRYLLAVPDSVAHGQRALLRVRLIGHSRMSDSVTLSGSRISRNFVMSIDTTHNHGLSIGAPDRIVAVKDLTISGRITDSASRGIQAAGVLLDGMGLSAQADVNGYYSLDVPRARVSGRIVKYSVQKFGYSPINDSLTLFGDAIHRDFVMSKPIYDMTAAQVLAQDKGMEQAAGLTKLENGPHRVGEREVRIRIFGSWVGPYTMYRLINRDGKTTGEHIWYWHVEPGEKQEPDTAAGARDLRRRCRPLTRAASLPCRVRFTRSPDWQRMWKSLDSLDVWSIADQGTLHKRVSLTLDASWIVAELWDGRSYRAWAYGPGMEVNEPGRDNVDMITSLLAEIDALTMP
jgi:hypothetical protein